MLIVLNVIVTIGVLRDSSLSTIQKTLQSAILWLFPIFGATFVLAFLGQNHTRKEMRSLVPSPFHMFGYKRPEKEYHDPPDAVCGGP